MRDVKRIKAEMEANNSDQGKMASSFNSAQTSTNFEFYTIFQTSRVQYSESCQKSPLCRFSFLFVCFRTVEYVPTYTGFLFVTS